MQKTFAQICLCVLISMEFTCSVFASTPTISGITGTISTGSTITILGQYFMEEVTTNWISPFRSGNVYGFEGTNPTADGFYAIVDNQTPAVYDTAVKLAGSKSVRFAARGASANCPSGNLTSYLVTDINQSDLYVRTYVRWHSTGTTSVWPASHIKMVDIMGTGDQLYFQPMPGGSRLPNQMSMAYNSANHPYPVANFLQDGRWYCMEMRFKSSSPTNFTTWVDGVQLASVNGVSVGSMSYLMFGLINLCETGSDFNLTHWMDNLTASTSRIYPSSLIEVGNSSDYAAATKNYQEPILLSDGSVQVKLDLTGLGSGPYYLWVTNNGQTRSASYALSGGGGETTPPTVSITSPSAGTVFGSITLSANASDNVSVAGVQFNVDGTPVGNEDTTAPYSISWDSASIANGSHTISAVARDAAGNTATASGVIVTVNNTLNYTTLFTEAFDDNNFASRGWFDDTSVSLDASIKYAGANSLKLTWGAGGTAPAGIAAMRKSFAPTDSLYVSMYWRFNSDWVGSGVGYHPHLVMIPSSIDDPWGGIAYNYLNTYIETSNLTPRLEIQDGMNVNTSSGSVPNNLTATTENRDVAGCNGCLSGSDCGLSADCYSVGGGTYWNGRRWNGSQNFALNTWHKVEAYFRMNSISANKGVADGIMQMWVNGTQVINKTNIIYRTNQHSTNKWATLVIAPWIGDGSPRVQTMWIDELTVGSGLPGNSSLDGPSVLKIVP
jgi:hypothetical protein